jgi:CRISPR/Cas system-associated exonuclease Cas4 (RecB family)
MWIARPPQSKASPPRLMSFSTLKEIESCPRRWWLRSVSYPEIWDERGYPDNPSVALLIGQILHQCIEEIVKAFNAASAVAIDDETFITTMRSLGGYPAVLKTESNRVMKKLESNPRVKYKLKELEDGLKTRLPQLREQLQIMVSNLDFDGKGRNIVSTNNNRSATGRQKLQNGFYAEVSLIAEELNWYGKADYLKLSDDGCEITDFKTGARKPEHELQLHVYNMLWAYDKSRNPNSIPVSRLVLAYQDGEKQIEPLSSVELKTFTEDILLRTAVVRDEISKIEPVAIPSLENCSYCPVRQLCSDYWTEDTQRFLTAEKNVQSSNQQKNNIDIEVQLEDATADHIWHARAVMSGIIEPQTLLLIRFAPTAPQLSNELKAGQNLRLLNVNLIDHADEESSLTSITTNWQSEIFFYS